jgi:hypothetical protein
MWKFRFWKNSWYRALATYLGNSYIENKNDHVYVESSPVNYEDIDIKTSP